MEKNENDQLLVEIISDSEDENEENGISLDICAKHFNVRSPEIPVYYNDCQQVLKHDSLFDPKVIGIEDEYSNGKCVENLKSYQEESSNCYQQDEMNASMMNSFTVDSALIDENIINNILYKLNDGFLESSNMEENLQKSFPYTMKVKETSRATESIESNSGILLGDKNNLFNTLNETESSGSKEDTRINEGVNGHSSCYDNIKVSQKYSNTVIEDTNGNKVTHGYSTNKGGNSVVKKMIIPDTFDEINSQEYITSKMHLVGSENCQKNMSNCSQPLFSNLQPIECGMLSSSTTSVEPKAIVCQNSVIEIHVSNDAKCNSSPPLFSSEGSQNNSLENNEASLAFGKDIDMENAVLMKFKQPVKETELSGNNRDKNQINDVEFENGLKAKEWDPILEDTIATVSDCISSRDTAFFRSGIENEKLSKGDEIHTLQNIPQTEKALDSESKEIDISDLNSQRDSNQQHNNENKQDLNLEDTISTDATSPSLLDIIKEPINGCLNSENCDRKLNPEDIENVESRFDYVRKLKPVERMCERTLLCLDSVGKQETICTAMEFDDNDINEDTLDNRKTKVNKNCFFKTGSTRCDIRFHTPWKSGDIVDQKSQGMERKRESNDTIFQENKSVIEDLCMDKNTDESTIASGREMALYAAVAENGGGKVLENNNIQKENSACNKNAEEKHLKPNFRDSDVFVKGSEVPMKFSEDYTVEKFEDFKLIFKRKDDKSLITEKENLTNSITDSSTSDDTFRVHTDVIQVKNKRKEISNDPDIGIRTSKITDVCLSMMKNKRRRNLQSETSYEQSLEKVVVSDLTNTKNLQNDFMKKRLHTHADKVPTRNEMKLNTILMNLKDVKLSSGGTKQRISKQKIPKEVPEHCFQINAKKFYIPEKEKYLLSKIESKFFKIEKAIGDKNISDRNLTRALTLLKQMGCVLKKFGETFEELGNVTLDSKFKKLRIFYQNLMHEASNLKRKEKSRNENINAINSTLSNDTLERQFSKENTDIYNAPITSLNETKIKSTIELNNSFTPKRNSDKLFLENYSFQNSKVEKPLNRITVQICKPLNNSGKPPQLVNKSDNLLTIIKRQAIDSLKSDYKEEKAQRLSKPKLSINKSDKSLPFENIVNTNLNCNNSAKTLKTLPNITFKTLNENSSHSIGTSRDHQIPHNSHEQSQNEIDTESESLLKGYYDKIVAIPPNFDIVQTNTTFANPLDLGIEKSQTCTTNSVSQTTIPNLVTFAVQNGIKTTSPVETRQVAIVNKDVILAKNCKETLLKECLNTINNLTHSSSNALLVQNDTNSNAVNSPVKIRQVTLANQKDVILPQNPHEKLVKEGAIITNNITDSTSKDPIPSFDTPIMKTNKTTLHNLIQSGLLNPEKDVLSVHTPEKIFFASLDESGRIISNGKTYLTPMQWCYDIPNFLKPGQKLERRFCYGRIYYQGRTLSQYDNVYHQSLTDRVASQGTTVSSISKDSSADLEVIQRSIVPKRGKPINSETGNIGPVLNLSKMKLLLIGDNEVCPISMIPDFQWDDIDKW